MFADEVFTFSNGDLVLGGVIIGLYLVLLYIQRTFVKKL